MTYHQLSRTIDLLNNSNHDSIENNDKIPSKNFQAKSFYKGIGESKSAKNLQKQLDIPPVSKSDQLSAVSKPLTHSRRIETRGLCKGLSPTKIRRALKSPSQNRLRAKKRSLISSETKNSEPNTVGGEKNTREY